MTCNLKHFVNLLKEIEKPHKKNKRNRNRPFDLSITNIFSLSYFNVSVKPKNIDVLESRINKSDCIKCIGKLGNTCI